MYSLVCGDKTLDLSSPQVMGIINLTPDSFSDGGQFNSINNALAQVKQMIIDGATIIDIGGESTRPGASEVSIAEEIARVIPVLKAIKSEFDIIVSVDTSKPEVMSLAAEHGAGIINDVRALQLDGALEVIAHCDLPVCLMHMQGQPDSMQNNPSYDNIFADMMTFFSQRIEACEQAGIERNRLMLDPGFGFGKTLQQNYQLLANFSYFNQLQLPLLAGLSRKSMIGNLLNATPDKRLAGSIAGAMIAVMNGARIVRVHDVKETVDALSVLAASNKEILSV